MSSPRDGAMLARILAQLCDRSRHRTLSKTEAALASIYTKKTKENGEVWPTNMDGPAYDPIVAIAAQPADRNCSFTHKDRALTINLRARSEAVPWG